VYPILTVVDELASDARRTTNDESPTSEPEAVIEHRASTGASSTVNRPSSSVAFRYVGEAGGAEEELARRAGIPFSAIETGQIRGLGLKVAAGSLLRMRRGAAQCSAIVREFRPDVVFLTGGYVSAPVALAAWRAHVPVLIYLPDVTPGQSIQWTSRLADRVAVSFPEVARYFGSKAVVTGYPVRADLLKTSRANARLALGLADDLPVLVVMGGSRGARSINRAVEAALPNLLPRCQVVHISGQLDWPAVEEAAKRVPEALAEQYHAYPYLHEMPLALAAADLVVARAGAATLGEFPAAGLPSILVPYPYSGQHQDANAAYLTERGAALTLRDNELEAKLGSTVLELLDAPERLAAMAGAVKALARPAAAANIARELRRLAEKSRAPNRSPR
jgi:UDP-N-acetylglucosamine--N-acetylmuramyl-(pentapeptide) pyrophosphoryl-undecaprenol N-acetylglucosamine transferase